MTKRNEDLITVLNVTICESKELDLSKYGKETVAIKIFRDFANLLRKNAKEFNLEHNVDIDGSLGAIVFRPMIKTYNQYAKILEIKADYLDLKNNKRYNSEQAFEMLSKKYFHSTKTIQIYVYTKLENDIS